MQFFFVVLHFSFPWCLNHRLHPFFRQTKLGSVIIIIIVSAVLLPLLTGVFIADKNQYSFYRAIIQKTICIHPQRNAYHLNELWVCSSPTCNSLLTRWKVVNVHSFFYCNLLWQSSQIFMYRYKIRDFFSLFLSGGWFQAIMVHYMRIFSCSESNMHTDTTTISLEIFLEWHT